MNKQEAIHEALHALDVTIDLYQSHYEDSDDNGHLSRKIKKQKEARDILEKEDD